MARQRSASHVRAFLVISTLAVAILLFLASAVQATNRVTPTVSYRVHAGDTLWEVAVAQGPEGADPRQVVAAIRRINGLEGSLIRPGEVLRIPAPGGG